MERVSPPVSNSMRMTRQALSNASKRSKLETPRLIKQPWLERYPSEVAPHMEQLKQMGPVPGGDLCFRKWILIDLLYLYQSILETYRPLTEAQKSSLRCQELPRLVQILKDTKFFVKQYQPPPSPAVIERNGTPGLLRLVCQVHLDTTVPPGLEHS